MGRISLIRISGARLTLCNTPDGPGFLEIRSHEKGPTYCVISSSVSLFRPAGSSLEIRYVPLFLLFFSSRYVSAQKRPVRRNSCMETSRSCWRYRSEACTCVGLGDWRFVRGGSYQWDIRTRRPEGWMALGWQTGYPAAHLEVRGSHLAWISQKDFRRRLVGHLGMKWLAACNSS